MSPYTSTPKKLLWLFFSFFMFLAFGPLIFGLIANLSLP
jgi:hypothetical protein